MIKIIKPASRLIIVFILTIVISGGILTYLSINSISNFKELTEKKITEEQLSIAAQLSEDFQQKLEDAAAYFTEAVMKENEADIYKLKYIDTLSLIETPFIINRNYGFIWPWFLENQGISSEIISSAAFMHDFRRAEIKEFREKDYKAAAYYYKLSQQHASGMRDSARSGNGLARVYLKMKNYERAFSCYSVITSNYYSITDYNGFPYVYYAILNILELSDSQYTALVFSEIEIFLSRMIDGKIPLNNSTAEILNKMSSWVYGSSNFTNKKTTEMETNIRVIESRLMFIDKYGKIIRTSLAQESSTNNPLFLGRYSALNRISGKPGELLFIDHNAELPLGFCIKLDQVWSACMGIDYCENTEFMYQIDLADKKESDFQDELGPVITTDLSMFSPSQMIRISLKDKNLVDIFVKRRSWAYGIALLLLLGAMLSGILLILRDIFRERRLSHLRSDFVSNVTHDLKTPLTSIHLFAESILLNRVRDDSDIKEYLKIILEETERLKRIINNILDFSRQEKGKSRIQGG